MCHRLVFFSGELFPTGPCCWRVRQNQHEVGAVRASKLGQHAISRTTCQGFPIDHPKFNVACVLDQKTKNTLGQRETQSTLMCRQSQHDTNSSHIFFCVELTHKKSKCLVAVLESHRRKQHLLSDEQRPRARKRPLRNDEQLPNKQRRPLRNDELLPRRRRLRSIPQHLIEVCMPPRTRILRESHMHPDPQHLSGVCIPPRTRLLR